MAQSPILTQDQLIEGVKKFATENYEKDGWDLLVETWDDDTIRQALGRSKKLNGAIWAVQQRLKPMYEAQKAHDAEAAAGAGETEAEAA